MFFVDFVKLMVGTIIIAKIYAKIMPNDALKKLKTEKTNRSDRNSTRFFDLCFLLILISIFLIVFGNQFPNCLCQAPTIKQAFKMIKHNFAEFWANRN